MIGMITVDDVVRMAIEDLFPDQSIPDQNNHVGKGRQHKAPDHLILNGKIAIERKSRNTIDQSQFYKKLQEIAAQQGAPFWGVGRLNFKAIIDQLPDPKDASQKMTDFMMNQVMKTMRKSQKKFEEYAQFVPQEGQARVLIISDNTEIRQGTAAVEYFIGRKMGALDAGDDQVKAIDATFYVKDPRCTIDEEDSYWFKAISRACLSQEKQQNVNGLASVLHHRISRYAPYASAANNFRNSSFRLCIV
ncbi:hypothetical protein G6L46_10935 [Agrobacterium rhizogenes]|uniref:hypothetical protein n=1 Tax=Rhizobium rhizogenes TaxID=359 RepID=UPI0015742D6A|nr:hypothetical protein [Rhizobium rhizogenes]NTF87639.1 hypothetical protein [Rhizobium rhizogenes]